MSVETVSHTPPNEVRYWSNSEGIWQILTPPEDSNLIHRSIHFGRKIESYEKGVLVREKTESLFIYEVSSDFQVAERPPTKEESYSFFIHAFLSEVPDDPLY